MQLVIVLLLVVALGLLVLGLVGSAPTLIVLSIFTSAVVGTLLVRSRRSRADQAAAARAAGAPTAEVTTASGGPAEELPASALPAGVLPADEPSLDSPAAPPGVPVFASDLIAAQQIAEVIEVPDEPAAANSEAPLRAHGNDIVAVIDGHPRYHAQRCRYLLGRASEAIPLRQAVEDGFTPCSMCDPDVVLAAAPTPSGDA